MLAAIWLAWVSVPRVWGTEVIHLFVALVDNASQGVEPVPKAIGDGDKPEANLYWGCGEGASGCFGGSKMWKKIPSVKPARAEILERLVFHHRERDAWLVADAWRGREIRACIEHFASVAAGGEIEEISAGDKTLRAGGAASLIAYIGHDGLMDFRIDWPVNQVAHPKPAIVLCCLSQKYFSAPLKAAGAHPLLTTTQLMYPGAFVLHDALEAWLAGRPAEDIRRAAGAAYAKNQKISQKAALGVFSTEPGP